MCAYPLLLGAGLLKEVVVFSSTRREIGLTLVLGKRKVPHKQWASAENMFSLAPEIFSLDSSSSSVPMARSIFGGLGRGR